MRRSIRPRLRVALGTALLCLVAGSAGATQVLVSTTNPASLGGLAFGEGDVVSYDDQVDLASLFFDVNAFLASEDVDAFHVLPNGHLLISTGGLADIGGLSISNGDVVDYDPIGDVATLLFAETLFLEAENVDAFSVLPNGNFLLSTTDGASLAGLAFTDGDLVEYDPVGGTASLFLSEFTFTSSSVDVDGVHAQSDTVVILTTTTTATIGGVTFTDGDLLRYDTASGTATVVFSQSAFTSGAEDIDAVWVEPPGFPVPEPGSGALLALGLAALTRRRFAAACG